jgi:hypothetical protein
VTPARTVWEEGRESGREVVALGFAVALTVVVVDVAAGADVGWFFDLCFVALCVALALAVRPSDFFVVGVLPPLLMGGLFALIAVARPESVGERGDGVVQATISGLSHHSLALVTGYALCLGVLFVRQRVAVARASDAVTR